ncbi:MAG: hypothetical protein AAF443_02745 [Chlamydiota bacterium]
MDTASWITLRYLLEHCAQEKQSAFLNYLSEKDRESLAAGYSIEADPFQNLASLESRIYHIHYSWFIPFLEPLPTSDKRCFIAALDAPIGTKLSAHFHLNPVSPSLSPVAKRYLQAKFFSSTMSSSQDFIPLALLPPHPLNPILNLTKNELQQVANLLGLRDLATEIKHIVQRQQMKKIQSTLSPQEKEVLKKLLINPPLPVFPSLNLDQWDGNEMTLKNILHQRGFNRLSKALFGCHPALMWHICHRLDTGRAKIIRRFFTDVKKASLKKILINQAVEVIAAIRETHE